MFLCFETGKLLLLLYICVRRVIGVLQLSKQYRQLKPSAVQYIPIGMRQTESRADMNAHLHQEAKKWGRIGVAPPFYPI